MRRRRELKSVLANFLGALASRYSDYDGYWIFGFVVADLTTRTEDLLSTEPVSTSADGAFVALARQRFREQLAKIDLDATKVAAATLELVKERTLEDLAGGFLARGHHVTLIAKATTDLGSTYERVQTIFVAVHNPAREHRSTRALT